MKKNTRSLWYLCAATAALPQVALAAIDITPDFGTVPTGWVTDRYQPHSFSNVGPYQGRTDVLGIEINSAQGMGSRASGQNSQFYNTQGMQKPISGGAGKMISADLYVPEVWGDGTKGSIRTDIWGVMSNGSTVTAYPILGFSNYGGAARFRAWDGDSGWVDLPSAVSYDDWNTLSIEFTGTSFAFSVNGTTHYVDATIAGSTGFSAIIMQAYNFFGDASLTGAVPVNYTAYWDNTVVVPEPSTYVAGALLALPFLAGAARRFRRTSVK